jgi:hypothetical protein
MPCLETPWDRSGTSPNHDPDTLSVAGPDSTCPGHPCEVLGRFGEVSASHDRAGAVIDHAVSDAVVVSLTAGWVAGR